MTDKVKTVEEINLEVDLMCEFEVFSFINEIGGFIWRMNHDRSHNRISDESWTEIYVDIVRLSEVQKHAVSILPKFGVKKPFQEDGKIPSEDYWLWFRWWDEYFKNMPAQTLVSIRKVMDQKGDISSYRPSGFWKPGLRKEETKKINRKVNLE